MNLVNNAKFHLIEDINNLIGTANIKGFWIFDQTGATTSITDRSPNAHTLTLGGNASTLSPAVAGLCPNLTMAGTAATSFYVADSDDFTPTGGWTVILLLNPTSMSNLNFTKINSAVNQEWGFLETGGNLYWLLYNPDGTKYTGVSIANPAYTNAWHTLIGTASTADDTATMVMYGDGAALGTTPLSAGGAFTVTNGNSTVVNFWANSATISSAKYGVAIIINKELTAVEVKRISDRLRAYAGVFI
jgi:hypothetical protein